VIPLAARIFALVDVFDALTSVRPYKPALSLDETLSIMEREVGQHFDPAIYAVFRQVAPMLYEQGQTRDHAQWILELKVMLERCFKMKTAPEGAATV
jgi:HD-GYP domain-containing protein (c-di-GMP phosphodiesterase class II)